MRAAVVGRPVSHSLSPVLHRAAYAALGLTDWTYDALDLGAEDLPVLLAGLGEEWRGFSVTMPCKQAAAADPVALGLPAYANGVLEGFLFPATYDVEPDQTAADVLGAMVARTDQVLTDLAIPVDQRLTALTKASMVQAEAGSVEDMGKVARVLENRLADGMALQLDTTVNYANGKGGITTTPEDRKNPSPYNTYVHKGLPPGPITNPGEQAISAVLNPTPGDWRFFVVVDPDSGDTRFAATKAEHDQNVELFRQWLRENPEG